jgi:amidohydrolase
MHMAHAIDYDTNASWWTGLDATLAAHEQSMIAFRRDMHQHPEASGDEYKSTEKVLQVLDQAGLEPRVMEDGRGLILDLDLGAPSDSVVALRADLDCVEIDDQKSVEWRSRHSGLCHACGHDAHTSMVLHAALAMHEHGDALRGIEPEANIRLLFQPAEETGTGAQDMIRQHALDGVRSILAVHVDPYLECGCIGLKTGPITANCVSFRITVTGRGGHSARPYQSIDPIPAAVNMVGLMYQLCPRSMDSRYPLALTVTSIHAGLAHNAIPDSAVICGTLRTARDIDQQQVQSMLTDVVRGVASTTGCTATLEFPHSSPATNNDLEVVELLWSAAEDVVSRDQVRLIEMPSLGGEDFAYYQQIVPGAMARLGAAFQDPNARFPLHSPYFDFNEAALLVGARFLCRAAIRSAATST